MIYFTAHTFKCVCLCRRAMFRVLGMYNFGHGVKSTQFMSISTSKKVLSKIQQTKSDPKKDKGWKVPSLMLIRVKWAVK